jgi:hypothetical protein
MCGIGCTHNYYYGYNPCTPGSAVVVPGTVQSGPVCEVPAGSTIVAGATPDTPLVVSKAKPPKVVVSEPDSNSGSRFWKPADPEGSRVTTKVEGGVDAPTVTR